MTSDLAAAFAHLDQFVERTMQAERTPGVALGLTDRTRLLRVATYGVSDLAAGTPVTPATLFEIGSIGKSFTAVALLRLSEAGRVDPHAPVTDYLPWFRVRSAYAPITLHHLLSHTAGIIAGMDATPDALSEVWALRHTVAGTPPGDWFHYSNVGYKVLGLVLEAVTGQAYGVAIREQILTPLGLTATEPVLTHAMRHRLAVGYQSIYDDRPPHASQPLAPAPRLETATGDGCLAAPPADLATYLRMLLNRGQTASGRLLSDASVGRLLGRVIEATDWPPGTFYGYGLTSREADGRTFIVHHGYMPGFAASMQGELSAGLGAVVLVNGPGAPSRIAAYAVRLLSAALDGRDLPPPPPVADPTVIANAADYAGTYTAGERTLTLVADGEHLVLLQNGASVVCESHAADVVQAPHPDWDRFLLRFSRVAGRVVAVSHGSTWFTRAGNAGPRPVNPPAAWVAYPGHYRAHNPWLPSFRVVLRQATLLLVLPTAIDGVNEEEPLIPLGAGQFRVGVDARSPERLRFGAIVDGRALRANLSGGDYYRFFTA